MSFTPGIYHLHHYNRKMSSLFLMGGALSFSVQKENYLHIPIIILFPSIYSGYHTYKNKAEIIAYFKEIYPNDKSWWGYK